MYGIVYRTGYSCQNKFQNIFWGRKSKIFLWRGNSPLHSTTPPQNQPPSAPAAPRSVFANPQLFFHNSHTGWPDIDCRRKKSKRKMRKRKKRKKRKKKTKKKKKKKKKRRRRKKKRRKQRMSKRPKKWKKERVFMRKATSVAGCHHKMNCHQIS